jgi:hypothetical protein
MIQEEMLKDPRLRTELQSSLAQILRGIREKWDIRIDDLKEILHMPEGTVKGWLKSSGVVGLSSTIDANTQVLIDFIQIYGMVSSFIVTPEDQIKWMNSPKKFFVDKSPLQLMKEDVHNIALTRELISRFVNP